MARKIKRFMPLADVYKLLKAYGFTVESFDSDKKVFDADNSNGDSVRVYYGGSGSDLYALKAI